MMKKSERETFKNWRWWLFVFIYLIPGLISFCLYRIPIVFGFLEQKSVEFADLYDRIARKLLVGDNVQKWIYGETAEEDEDAYN